MKKIMILSLLVFAGCASPERRQARELKKAQETREQVLQQNLGTIKPGMTRDEVREKIGEPMSVEIVNKNAIWVYSYHPYPFAPGKTYYATFDAQDKLTDFSYKGMK